MTLTDVQSIFIISGVVSLTRNDQGKKQKFKIKNTMNKKREKKI